MPRIDENGNAEFHPAELPRDYVMPEMDPNNSTIRIKVPQKKSTRSCKNCGASFELIGDYDPENKAHDLCDDCLIELPKDPDQKYSASTYQIEMDVGTPLTGGDDA